MGLPLMAVLTGWRRLAKSYVSKRALSTQIAGTRSKVCCDGGDIPQRGAVEGKLAANDLLSDEMRDMSGLHFEGAVVRPQVDRICYTSATSLINLLARQLRDRGEL